MMRSMESRASARLSFRSFRNELMVCANKWVVSSMLSRAHERTKAAFAARKIEIEIVL